MISRELAAALQRAGLEWTPRSGDRFSLHNAAFDGDVFTLAEMTIETQGPPDNRVLGFNGTTEWALDSVEFADTLWLPREDQLREQLGEVFERLERTESGYSVIIALPERIPEPIPADSVADAYALALLAKLNAQRASD